MDSEFRIPVTLCWVLRRDISDPIPFCACEMIHQYADRIHVRSWGPIQSSWWKSLHRLENVIVAFFCRIFKYSS